jgi:hypothetical protein
MLDFWSFPNEAGATESLCSGSVFSFGTAADSVSDISVNILCDQFHRELRLRGLIHGCVGPKSRK